MDKISKKVLKRIINSPEQTIRFQGMDEPFDDISSYGNVNTSLEFLSDHDYITLIYNNDQLSEVRISYRSAHPVRYMMKLICSYLLNNWIAITALIISVLALLKQ